MMNYSGTAQFFIQSIHDETIIEMFWWSASYTTQAWRKENFVLNCMEIIQNEKWEKIFPQWRVKRALNFCKQKVSFFKLLKLVNFFLFCGKFFVLRKLIVVLKSNKNLRGTLLTIHVSHNELNSLIPWVGIWHVWLNLTWFFLLH